MASCSPTQTNFLNSPSSGEAQLLAQGGYQLANIEKTIRGQYEDSYLIVDTSISDIKIEPTSVAGVYRFTAEFTELDTQRYVGATYILRGLCDMRSKTVRLNDKEFKGFFG